MPNIPLPSERWFPSLSFHVYGLNFSKTILKFFKIEKGMQKKTFKEP